MKKYHGKIFYTIDENHPDIKFVEGWKKGKIYTFEDVYTVNDEYPTENIKAYIKADLKLVAGGGYGTEHIHNVKFEINRV